MTIQANFLQNILFQFCIIYCQKRNHGPNNTSSNPRITKCFFLSMQFQMPRSSVMTLDINDIVKILHLINHYYWFFIRAIVGKITKIIPLINLKIA